ncbi:MAG TPA: hypothetical protein VNT51_10875 [Miltoncostaeaceae bacterium]|nr:hypothetical protein [Miltoncostaeaceae bacterium]
MPARRLTGLVLVLALAGGVALLWRAASRSTPVTQADAVAAYRAEAPRAAGAVTPGVPAPGVYTYRATGGEDASVGPLSISRPVPAEARYVVTPAPGGYAAELRVSREHVEEYRYRVAGGWTRVTWRRVDVRFLGLGRDDRRDVVPAARWVPLRPRPGMRWTVDFRTGSLRTRGEGAVVGRTTLPLGGRREPVAVVRTTTRTTGAHGGRRDETLWWSPRLALPVRITSDTRLGGVAAFRGRLRLDLVAEAPAR